MPHAFEETPPGAHHPDGLDQAAPPAGDSPPAPVSLVPIPIPPASEMPTAPDTAHPLREIVRIAAPSVATMTSYTLMTFVDALMVSRITPADPVYLAAQGNGGISAWLPQSIMAGMLGVVNTYVSQNLGAGRPKAGAPYAWNGLWLCLFLWVFMIPYALLLPMAFRALGHAPRLVELESQYAFILLAGAILQMGSRGLTQFFYGMHKPGVVLVAALAGNVVNLGAGYILIFGKLGFPALGVPGAGVGTVIGCAVEFAIPLTLFLSKGYNDAYATRSSWRFSRSHVRDILKIGWPGAMMFLNEMVCWWYFMVGMTGRFGEAHNTAGWIALRYMHLSFMPAVGISNAMTSIVGRYLGMGRPDLAENRARLGLRIAMIYMGLCAICFVFLRVPMVTLFQDDPEIIRIGSSVMVVAAVFQVFDALGITMFGTLRGAGDTVFPGVITVLLVWIFLVGGGHLLMWQAPGLESLGPWIGAATYISLFGLILYARFQRGHWRTIKLVPAPTAAAH